MSLVTIERSNSSDDLNEPCDTTDSDAIDGDSDDIFSRSRTSSFEGFFASKGAAYAIPDGDFARKPSIKGSEIHTHLQGMVNLIRDEDTMRLVVKLECPSNFTQYLTIVTTYGVTDEEESILLGFDWVNEVVTIGLVVPLWNNVELNLNGDGGFKVTTEFEKFLFKPVSVQTMWCALQWIHRCLAKARKGNHFIGGMSHTWLGYYKNRISSPWECKLMWEVTDELLNKRDETHELAFDKIKTDEELLKGLIRCKLKEVLTRFDLEEVTCRHVREILESEMNMSLRHLKGYVDEQMLVVVGRMDSSSQITDHIYLGSEWNASNYEELKENGVGYILNVTKEIDNFFSGTFEYMNIRVFDLKEEDLLHHWGKTYRFLHAAKENGLAALVHCRRGISRSASTVVAYLMKEYKMSLNDAMRLVKSKRSIVQPNPGFWKQLIIYEGILRSSEHRHSSLFRRRSNSDSVKRVHKKSKHTSKKVVDQTDGNEPPLTCEQKLSNKETSRNSEEDFTETSPVSDISKYSFSTSSEEDINSTSDEDPSITATIRRTLSEPLMKVLKQEKPVLRKTRAQTFNDYHNNDCLIDIKSLSNNQDVKQSNVIKAAGDLDIETHESKNTNEIDKEVIVIEKKESFEDSTEEIAASNELFKSLNLESASNNMESVPSENSKSIGEKLEEKLLIKHCERKKVRHRRRERSKSDLQLCQSGFVKRHTQIIEEHMLHMLLADSKTKLGSLDLNIVESQMKPEQHWNITTNSNLESHISSITLCDENEQNPIKKSIITNETKDQICIKDPEIDSMIDSKDISNEKSVDDCLEEQKTDEEENVLLSSNIEQESNVEFNKGNKELLRLDLTDYESPCNIVVDDYNMWESAAVCDRIKILENIIAKTGGTFPSPRSKRERSDCVKTVNDFPIFDNEQSENDEKVKHLVDKFGGK